MKPGPLLLMLGAIAAVVSCQGLREAKPGRETLSGQETRLPATTSRVLNVSASRLPDLVGSDYSDYRSLFDPEGQVPGVSSWGLTNLDVSAYTNLLALRCARNQLTCLDVSRNSGLDYLNCWCPFGSCV